MTAAAVVNVRVTPRSGRDAIEGVDTSGALHVRVAAPPADGAANASVTRLLAKELHLPKGALSVIAGASSRHKRLRIEGLDARALRERWPGLRVTESW